MTGYKDLNFPAFHKAKEVLEERGYEVVSPADYGAGGTWESNLRRDIKLIMQKVDQVITLPFWYESRGATLEVFIATQVGIPVREFTPKNMLPKSHKIRQEMNR